jgi:hypothetical protein
VSGSLKGGGSLKGRVIGNRLARPAAQFLVEREGSCAWCGFDIRAPKDQAVACPRCRSFEIDWIEPKPAPPTPAHVSNRTRDEQWVPGSIAYSLLGARVVGRR